MSTGVLDDRAQVRAAAAGNVEAFGALARRWMSTVSNIALAITRDPVGADDVTQDVFLVAWRKLPQLRNPGVGVGLVLLLAHGAGGPAPPAAPPPAAPPPPARVAEPAPELPLPSLAELTRGLDALNEEFCAWVESAIPE